MRPGVWRMHNARAWPPARQRRTCVPGASFAERVSISRIRHAAAGTPTQKLSRSSKCRVSVLSPECLDQAGGGPAASSVPFPLAAPTASASACVLWSRAGSSLGVALRATDDDDDGNVLPHHERITALAISFRPDQATIAFSRSPSRRTTVML